MENLSTKPDFAARTSENATAWDWNPNQKNAKEDESTGQARSICELRTETGICETWGASFAWKKKTAGPSAIPAEFSRTILSKTDGVLNWKAKTDSPLSEESAKTPSWIFAVPHWGSTETDGNATAAEVSALSAKTGGTEKDAARNKAVAKSFFISGRLFRSGSIGRFPISPFPKGGDGFPSVGPTDFFSLGNRTRVVIYGDFANLVAESGDLGRNLGTEFEPVANEFERLDQIGFDQLVAGGFVGYALAVEHVGH